MLGYVILFGSAAAGDANPRDLDVVYGGDYSADDAERLAIQWWRQRFPASASLPVETHRQERKVRGVYRPQILRPTGAETEYLRLAGEVEVDWYDVDSLPAALRLASDGERKLAEKMVDRLRRQGVGRGVPLSMSGDKGLPVGGGGYAGDGPVALETALARTARVPVSELLPTIPSRLAELLAIIRQHRGVWSGHADRWGIADRGGPVEGIRHWWQSATPLGCRGYAGDEGIRLEYASRPLDYRTLEEVFLASVPGSQEVA